MLMTGVMLAMLSFTGPRHPRVINEDEPLGDGRRTALALGSRSVDARHSASRRVPNRGISGLRLSVHKHPHRIDIDNRAPALQVRARASAASNAWRIGPR